jgi:integrase
MAGTQELTNGVGCLYETTYKKLRKLEDAAAAAAETGDDHYRRVSTHDLRRCWANHLLVEESVSPCIVMALGGWSSYNAIEPYLAAPTEDNIITSMSRVDL